MLQVVPVCSSTNTPSRTSKVSSDVKAPAIYRRFGSKDGLSEAVLQHYVDRVVRRRIEKYLPDDGDPMANIREFLGQWGAAVARTVRR